MNSCADDLKLTYLMPKKLCNDFVWKMINYETVTYNIVLSWYHAVNPADRRENWQATCYTRFI